MNKNGRCLYLIRSLRGGVEWFCYPCAIHGGLEHGDSLTTIRAHLERHSVYGDTVPPSVLKKLDEYIRNEKAEWN